MVVEAFPPPCCTAHCGQILSIIDQKSSKNYRPMFAILHSIGAKATCLSVDLESHSGQGRNKGIFVGKKVQ